MINNQKKPKPKPKPKVRSLNDYLKNNLKKKEEQTLKHNNDPVIMRQLYANKLCQARTNIQKMQNQHQSYLKQILLMNEKQRTKVDEEEAICTFYIMDEVESVEDSLFSLARGKCTNQQVSCKKQSSLEHCDKQFRMQQKIEQQQTDSTRKSKDLMDKNVEQGSISLMLTNHIQPETDTNIMVQQQRDYGVKKSMLTPELINQFKEYQQTGKIPDQYLKGYKKDFPLALKNLEILYKQ